MSWDDGIQMLEHKYKVMISGSAFRLYEEGANHSPHHNTLIRIKYVAYISELTEDARDYQSSCSKTFQHSRHEFNQRYKCQK